MGKTNNILGITGSVGNIVFKANGTVSQKPPKRGNKNLTERVKQNISEFQKSARAGKIVRKALEGIKKNFVKGTVGKIVKIMREYIDLDTINVRGERKVLDNNVDNLSQRLWEELIYLRELRDMWKTGAKPTVSIDNLGNVTTNIAIIWQNIYLNVGATHLSLTFEITRFSFEEFTGTRTLIKEKVEVTQYDTNTNTYLPYFNNGVTSAGLNSLLAGKIPSVSIGDQIIVTVRLQQFQKVNAWYSKLKGEWTLVESRKIT